jgi:hypothetical protein
MPTKQQWLSAVKEKIADYKKDWRSYGNASQCSFCRLNGYKCYQCIMTHGSYAVGCLYMRTFPQGKPEHVENRIEFLTKAYDVLAKLPTERFADMDQGTTFPELWELDASMPINMPHTHLIEERKIKER